MFWAWILAMQVLLPVSVNSQFNTVYEQLPNGAKVIAFIRPATPYPAASLWVKSGSASDPPNREGTAHLLEHLLPLKPFNGTTIQIAVERKGALLIPETGRDFMAFHLQAENETITEVFPMLVEAVTELTVDMQVVEREKRLMWLETLALYEDPLWLMKTAIEAKLFEGTPYAHPPTGWLETLSQLSFADAQQFHRTHFVAPNFALIAVVPDEKTLTVLKNHVAKLPSPSEIVAAQMSLSRSDFQPTFDAMLKRALTRTNEVFWGIGWRIPVQAREKVAMDALVLHLRQVLLPTLFGQIGVVQEWNMLANPVRGSIALTITARLRPYTELLEQRLKQVLDEIARRDLPLAELNCLKRNLRWEYFRVLSNPTRCVRELGWAWALFDDPETVERYGKALEDLNSEQVRQLASRLNSTKPVVWLVR
ncbi:MAG: insulinase family protein [Armatimonadetes bacterium]|nr:insulinase family protein [Armatimonadota bacterium]